MTTLRLFCALILLLCMGSSGVSYGQTGTSARRVSGRVYFDRNGNGRRDTAEGAFPIPLVLGNPARHQFQTDTLPTGIYEIWLDTAITYNIRLLEPPRNYRLTEGAGGHSGRIPSPIQADTGRNFGIAPLARGLVDVRVTLTPHTAARIGRVLRYRARLENVGTQRVASGQVTVVTDQHMSLLGALPPPTSTQPTVQTWNYTNLAPLEVRNFEVRVTLPVNTTIGTPLYSSASATVDSVDINPFDNIDTLRQVVVSSFDPNCISVNHTLLSPSQVLAGAPLDYLVQFENLGNDTAFAVTIKDTLPANFMQMGTLQVVATSHNCMWRVTGDGLLSIGFPHIRLPYQGIDALLSSGFVRFRLKPLTTLTIGTLIPNAAHITFDFNPPLSTNDVETLVGSPSATPALLAEAAGWTLYPNPATTTASLTADAATAGPAIITLLDRLGRVVQTQHILVGAGAQRLPLDLAGVPAGLYVVRLTLPGSGTGTRRLVVSK